jgi:hypothetical protein
MEDGRPRPSKTPCHSEERSDEESAVRASTLNIPALRFAVEPATRLA